LPTLAQDWQGGIKDENGKVIDYNLGPGMKNGQQGFMFVKTEEEYRDTTNVLGYFEVIEKLRSFKITFMISGNSRTRSPRDSW
jgi:hypothetical protein